ncbi:hypothetical protein J7E25_03080 [Agromyces sp. ISL-38]|uniref:KAP family P-loop NTPase fold protein n=1 Tax=Agromyces sp. ISL-38 TaxID=2819107 RepID=UPI001BEA2829|nr:P-loop NTPase fold protein [Agromyces sp. ISL-38]MBT2498071.1 hypothetical protein [Agromyces sp. ISL-38]
MTELPVAALQLLSDEPATTDLLSFSAIADTVVDALFDDTLNPVALGISGTWGSGKTTVLNLIDKRITGRSTDERTIVVVRADPWRYDPSRGPKESLISAVLTALADEFKGSDLVKQTAGEALKNLARRVNWSKAIKMAATTALTAQLPSLDAVMGLVSDEPETLDSEKGMDNFREEFESLLEDEALSHVRQVVVLVDDLDRCLPQTVLETLEAIRLFLSAEGMSFVIAADEARVAEAIQQKLQTPDPRDGTESIASLYLHKIVQTTVPLPALSYFDTRAYLFLLLVRSIVESKVFAHLVADCDALRVDAGSLDDLQMPEGVDLAASMATASRLTPVLYEKFQGNPRRIKRFMNDLYIRQSVAARRGIKLEPDAIAKLMVMERLFRKDFEALMDWLASGSLRGKLNQLQLLARGGQSDADTEKEKKVDGDPAAIEGEYSSTMVRWAKLPPELEPTLVSGYLTLAAAFQGRLLVDESLSETLRDLAAALTSSSQIDRTAVKDNEIKALPPGDVVELLAHLGRRMRDDPSIQLPTVNAIVTIATLHPSEIEDAKRALSLLPGAEVKSSSVLVLNGLAADYADVLDGWSAGADDITKRAIVSVRKQGA